MLIDIQNLLAAWNDEMAQSRAVKALADELNSQVPEYRVTYTHFDTGDYLEFVKREPSDFLPEED